jgi:hypothetical protein
MKVNKKYSRGFLLAASAYRRHAKDFIGDFSEAALHEQYERETLGKPVSLMNGYAVGKKFLDATIKAQKEDFQNGLFSKKELLQGISMFVKQQIKTWKPVVLFIYR